MGYYFCSHEIFILRIFLGFSKRAPNSCRDVEFLPSEQMFGPCFLKFMVKVITSGPPHT